MKPQDQVDHASHDSSILSLSTTQASLDTVLAPNAVQGSKGRFYPHSDISQVVHMPANGQGTVPEETQNVLAELGLPADDLHAFDRLVEPYDTSTSFPVGVSMTPLFDANLMFAPCSGLQDGNFGLTPSQSPIDSPSQSGDTRDPEIPFLIDDDGYSNALSNLRRFDPYNKLSELQFPSKYALVRFVQAFFRHMAPHFPIVHQPTFDVASAPSRYCHSRYRGFLD